MNQAKSGSFGVVPYLLLLLSTASWGGNWVASRAVYQEVTPFALVFWRWGIAAIIIFPFALPHLHRDLPAALKHWRWMLFFGITGPAAFPVLGYLGIRYTTAVNAAILNSSVPLMTIPFAWLILRHTVKPRQAAGLICSLAGVTAIITGGHPTDISSLSLNPGDLLILTAVVLWALYTVMLYRRPPMHPLSFLFFTALVAIVLCIPFYAREIAAGDTFALSLRSLTAVGYLALFPSVIAFICWNYAVPLVGPNVATFFYPAAPVFGSLAAYLVLDEQLHAYHLAGFALVLAGLILTAERRRGNIPVSDNARKPDVPEPRSE